jgi:hypothetical protein
VAGFLKKLGTGATPGLRGFAGLAIEFNRKDSVLDRLKRRLGTNQAGASWHCPWWGGAAAPPKRVFSPNPG